MIDAQHVTLQCTDCAAVQRSGCTVIPMHHKLMSYPACKPGLQHTQGHGSTPRAARVMWGDYVQR